MTELDRSKLQAARLWVAHYRPYFASALYRCPVVVTDSVDTFAVDEMWRMYINPAYANSLDVSRFAAALIHEINHLLRDHADRARSASVVTSDDRYRWNLAADAEINDDLLSDGLDVDRSDWIFPSTLGHHDHLTAEMYFRLIASSGTAARFEPGRSVGTRPASRTAWECGQGAGGRVLGAELPANDLGAPAVSNAEARIIRDQVARDVIEYSRNGGTVPGELLQWAGDMVASRVDWRRLLAGAIRSAVSMVSGASDYTYQRFGRRNSAAGAVRLPGMMTPTAQAAIVIDTSGSMSDDDIAQSLAEVRGILRSESIADHAVTVLTVDTAVAATVRVTGTRSMWTMGRGGTDMTVGIEAAIRTRPHPNIVVVLTDGFTPWPEHPPPGVQVIVGLLGSLAATGGRPPLRPPPPPPWTRVIRITS